MPQLNKDLVDKKDITIARLKHTIEEFKKYDIERKEYYKEVVQELGKLKAYIDELEEDPTYKKLRTKLTNTRKEIIRLNKVIVINKYGEADKCLNELALRSACAERALEIGKLRKQLKQEKEAKTQLLSLIAKLRNDLQS